MGAKFIVDGCSTFDVWPAWQAAGALALRMSLRCCPLVGREPRQPSKRPGHPQPSACQECLRWRPKASVVVQALQIIFCASLVQAEFDKLQEGYRTLKAQKLAEVDKMMEGLSKKTEGHVETAARLTEHWKAEAMRQAGFAQAASDMQVGGLPWLA